MAKGARLVTAIGFSPSGKWIAATDAAEKIEVHLFERGKGGKAKFTCEVGKKCVNLSWMAGDDVMFGVAGAKHLSFFAVDFGKKSAKKTTCKLTGSTNISSISWCKSSKYKGHWVAGGSDGKCYYGEKESGSKAIKLGKSVQSVCSAEAKFGEIVLVGTNEKAINAYKYSGKLDDKPLWTLDTADKPLSLDLFNETILMGLKNGSLLTMPMAEKAGEANLIMTSHCDGEVWGLQVVDIGKGELRAITSADDNRILTYDVKKHKALAEGTIKEKSKYKEPKGYRGGASSMSSKKADQ